MKRHQVMALFCCCLLGFLSIFGCGGGGGGGGGGSGSTLQTVTLQGRVDDGLQHSPIANATCNFSDLQGTPLATATADGSGTFQFAVPLNVQGFLHCAPPSLPHLEMSTFVSTVGRTTGQTIANLTVSPTTTLVAAVLTNTSPPDPQARAAELIALLGASDPDLSLLAQASTVLYTAQLATGIDVAFSSGSESDGVSGDGGSSDGGGPDGGGPGDGGGTGGDAGDGGAFSPLPGAVCDFALRLDGPVLRNATLADFLANGTVRRPDLQAIASQVNAALAGQQAAVAAAFSRLFPTGLGRPISTTADANGLYFLSTPPGVPGFVRCNPAEATNLVLARFVQARQTGGQLLGQTVTPATTVAVTLATDALEADPTSLQQAFLADSAPLQILLPNHPNGNGMFATVNVLAPLPNPNTALLVFAATTIFDTMRLQRATIPTTVTFADALQDYFQDATFAPQLDPLLTPAVNMALDQGQPKIGLGRNDIPQAASTIAANPLSPRFAYVANGFDGTVSMYIVDATTGQLRHNGYVAAGLGPRSVTVDPSGRFAYVANGGSNTISGYTISASSGALTPVPGSPFAAGITPGSVTVDPSGRFAYVANERSNTISGYTISASSGALTPIPGSPFAAGTNPFSVTVDPSGRFAYVANFGSNNISGYTISASSGVLTSIAGSPFPAGVGPIGVITSGITQ